MQVYYNHLRTLYNLQVTLDRLSLLYGCESVPMHLVVKKWMGDEYPDTSKP